MNKRCPNIQQVLVCDCPEGKCHVREALERRSISVNKEEQKKLLTEIMEADEKDGLYKQQTAVDYLLSQLPNRFRNAILNECSDEIKKARQIGKQQIMDAFINGGYDGLRFPKVKECFDKEYLESKFIKYYIETYGK